MTDVTILTPKKANIIIDASNYDLFDLCPQRYNYRVNLRRSLPIIQKNRALDKGSIMHLGFEVYYSELAKGTHFNDRMQKTILRMRAAGADSKESNLEIDELEFLVKVAQENLDYWRFEDETLEILCVEQTFAYTIYEDEDIRIIMSGMIDVLCNKPALGGSSNYSNLPIDHKTYSRDSEVLRLSNQFQNYCAAVGSNYLMVNRIGLQETKKPDEKYKRLMLSYDPLMLQQWKDNVTRVMLQDYATCVATGVWPMRYSSCLKFNRKCEYFEVCDSSGESSKQFKLDNNYVDADPWDVTKRMEE